MESETRIVRLEESVNYIKNDLHKITEAIKEIAESQKHQTKLFEENIRIHSRLDKLEEKATICASFSDTGCPALKNTNHEIRDIHKTIVSIKEITDELEPIANNADFIKQVPFITSVAKVLDSVFTKMAVAALAGLVTFYFTKVQL